MKIIKIVATKCQILRLKCTKSFVGWGVAPDPANIVDILYTYVFCNWPLAPSPYYQIVPRPMIGTSGLFISEQNSLAISAVTLVVRPIAG